MATSGFEGCSVEELVATIETHCGGTSGYDEASDKDAARPSGLAAMVWQWIVDRPDVYVGSSKDRRLNALTLSSVLALSPVPRVHAADDVMWKAIAGHGPDLKRVPKFEWEALVGIASMREDGIIQGDLCRLTGQDKRSLPKRTDALAKKKYIEKRATLVRGTKTSKLWLRRYAPPLLTADGAGGHSSAAAFDYKLPGAIETDKLDAVPWAAAWTGQAIDYLLFGKTIISTVRAFGVLRYDDLRTKLGIQHRRWQMRVMARSCRFFVKAGALQFVAASMNNRVYRDCLKFADDVSPEAWAVYLSSSSKKVKKTRRQQIKEEEARPAAERRSRLSLNHWSPDVPFQDVILEAMLAAGDEGITNTELTAGALAPSFGRYVANLSMSITARDLQPAHLRHMQIRSELTRNGKTTTYRYYAPSAADVETQQQQSATYSAEEIQADNALRYGFAPLAGPVMSRAAPGRSGRGSRARKKVIILDENGDEDGKTEDTSGPVRPRGRPKKATEGEDEGEGQGEDEAETKAEAEIEAAVEDEVESGAPGEAEAAESQTERTSEATVAAVAAEATVEAEAEAEAEAEVEVVEKAPTKTTKSKTPARKAAASANGWTCPSCGGTWKNDIGLKYHQTKSRTKCNPNWDDKPITPRKMVFPSLAEESRRRRRPATESPLTPSAETETPGAGAETEGDVDVDTDADAGLFPIFRKSNTRLRGGLVIESRDARAMPALRTPAPAAFRALAPGETFETGGGLKSLVPCKSGVVKKASRRSLTARSREVVAESEAEPEREPEPEPEPELAEPAVKESQEEYPESILDTPTPGPSSSEPQLPPFVMPPIPKMDTLSAEVIQLRRAKEVVRYIVRTNLGVFPAKTALWQALCFVWASAFPNDAPPAYEVSLRAAKECGRIRPTNDHLVEITYGFKDKQGGNSRCHVLVEAHLDKQGAVVEALKNNIKEAYPHPYIPAAFAPAASDGPASQQQQQEPTTPLPHPLTRRKRALGGQVMVLDAPLYQKQVAEKAAQRASLVGRRRKRPFSWADIGLPRKRLKALIEEDGSVWENPATVRFLSSEPVLAFLRPNECLDLEAGEEDEDESSEGEREEEEREEEREEQSQSEISHDQIDPRLFIGFDQTSGHEVEQPRKAEPEPEPYTVRFAPLTTIHQSAGVWPRKPLHWFGGDCGFTLSDALSETLWERALQQQQQEQEQDHDEQQQQLHDVHIHEPVHSGVSVPTIDNLEAVQTYRLLSLFPDVSVKDRQMETTRPRELSAQPQTQSQLQLQPQTRPRQLSPSPSQPKLTQFSFISTTVGPTNKPVTISSSSSSSNNNIIINNNNISSSGNNNFNIINTNFTNSNKQPSLSKDAPIQRCSSPETPNELVGVSKPKGRPSVNRSAFGGLAAKPPPPAANTERIMADIPEDDDSTAATGTPSSDDVDAHWYKGSRNEAITAAFIAVRVLLGGTDKAIDWAVMRTLFPSQSLVSLRKFWVRLLKDQATLVRSYTDRFQNAFVKAYENGDVPPLDFDRLADYDWRPIINWTVSLHKDDRVPLPVSRDGFRRQYELGAPVHNVREWRDVYYNSSSSIFARYEAITSEASAISIDSGAASPAALTLPENPSDETLARSWLRSLALTPGDKSTSSQVISKFMTLASGHSANVSKLLEGAVAALSADHIISKGKILTHRDRLYRLNKQFRSQFDKAARVSFFMEARTFKRALDAAHATAARPHLPVPFLMPDGAVMVLINMAAHGRVRLRGRDVPHIPLGFDPGNYESRKMPKSLLLFALDAEFTTSYMPSARVPIVARAAATPLPKAGPRGLLPFWVDFFGDLDRALWQAVLGMLCSLVATRGPMTERTLLEDLHPLLDAVDVKLAVRWARKVGLLCAPKTLYSSEGHCDQGQEVERYAQEDDAAELTVSEWWWLVVAEQGVTPTAEQDEQAQEAFQQHTVMLNVDRI